MVRSIGDPRTVAFEIGWDNLDPGSSSAGDYTLGTLRLIVGGEVVWAGESDTVGFDWPWVELAEFIAKNWPYLIWEEGLPLGTRGGSLAEIRSELSRRWDSTSEAARDEDEEALDLYQERHDLARALGGAIVPSLLLAREGKLYSLTTETASTLVPADETISTLKSLSEEIIHRAAEAADQRASLLQAAWETREQVEPLRAAEIATGLEAGNFRLVVTGLEDIFSKASEVDALNELTAAARMSSALPVGDVRQIVQVVDETPPTSAASLDVLSEKVLHELPIGRPYDEGYAAAVWLREQLGVTAEEQVEPADVLTGWSITLRTVRLGSAAVDAVACWGPRHGPAVIVNSNGRHANSPAGRRSTIAHEICHLLIDRGGALPLAEVMGGRAPARTEERARAFAAELLIPRDVAGRELRGTTDAAGTLRDLQRTYGVSAELVAWQARNSQVRLAPEIRSFLRGHVSWPERF